jgi:hypothetical protein
MYSNSAFSFYGKENGGRRKLTGPSLSVVEFLNNLHIMELRNRVGNRVVAPARQATQSGGMGSLGSILRLIKSLKIQTLCIWHLAILHSYIEKADAAVYTN